MPGLEVFFREELRREFILKEPLKEEKPETDWADNLEQGTWNLLLSDRDLYIFALAEKAISGDLSKMIEGATGRTSAWSWEKGAKNAADSGVCTRPMLAEKATKKTCDVTTPFADEMDSDFAYPDMSLEDCIAQMSKDPDLNKAINNEHKNLEPIKNETIIINLGTNENPKKIQIGSTLSTQERSDLNTLLEEFQDVFAWSYEDMPGIDPEIVQHRINIKDGFRPVKQRLRRMQPEWQIKVKEEVSKLLKVGFIQAVNQADWIANIVPVPKKDGRVRVCVDYRDLNKACPKDDFPLPHIDILVDNTAGSALMSFMDGFSGYNQIRMAPEDMTKTTFTTGWGTYCYTVMPFRLKNAGATYQRMATTLLHDMMHQEVEVYVDDMIVKSETREGHLPNLRKFFKRIRKYKLRINPRKCTFGVTSGKLLGFLVTNRGIEVDSVKVKAILEMPPPKTEKEIRGFLGRLQYISRFIARLTSTCEPIFKLLRKGEPKEWNDQCQQAFETIKEYLLSPPILVPPRPGKPLMLYLSIFEEALGSMLAQRDDRGSERAIYYLSKKLHDYETRYTVVEKSCFALVWAVQKLRHILINYEVQVICRMDPLKYLFEKQTLNGRLSRWLFLLAGFELVFVTQKAKKGGAVSNYCGEHPVLGEALNDDFPDENLLNVDCSKTWKMYFDGASNQYGDGIGVIVITPEGSHIPLSVKLNFQNSNNTAEYEACIAGLEALLILKAEEVEVFGDSTLVIAQVQNIWKTKEEHLKPYQNHLERLAHKF